MHGQRRGVRRPAEPDHARSAGVRPDHVRPQRQGLRRLGDPPPPRRPGHDACDARSSGSARPAIVRGIVVDTAWFARQLPARGGRRRDCACRRRPGRRPSWSPLVERSQLAGDTENAFDVAGPRPVTHVRLRIFPDGGVARLRVHGEAAPDPAAAGRAGHRRPRRAGAGRTRHRAAPTASTARRTTCCCPARPGRWARAGRPRGAATTATTGSRSRWPARARSRVAELDTSWFLHNAPGLGVSSPGRATASGDRCCPAPPLHPDTRHRFVLADVRPCTARAAGRVPRRRHGPAAAARPPTEPRPRCPRRPLAHP